MELEQQTPAMEENQSEPQRDENEQQSEVVTTVVQIEDDSSEDTAVKTFTQEDLDRIVKERLARAKQKAESEAENARKEAERQQLKEKEQYKTLYEELQAELAQSKRELMLNSIATKHGLPEQIKDRLIGETEEELEQDALRLAELFEKKPEKPSIQPQTKVASSSVGLSEEQQKLLKEKFGIIYR